MKPRVLIVDDEPSIVLSLEFLLTQAGYDVIVAGTGPDALRLARDHAPDLALLDVMLPGVDGFEVCRAIRADPAIAAMRILMLTARGREGEAARGLALGADAYLIKPFGTRELMEAVRALLERPGRAQGLA